MKRILPILLFNFSFYFSFAEKISGTVTDDKGDPLPFASVFIKRTTTGTTCNAKGKFSFDLNAGEYILVCEHVGYAREEKKVIVTNENLVINFQLQLQQLTMKEVIVKKGEDPAYEIIRKTIKKRIYYKDQLSNFSCEVYTKGQLNLRNFPKKFLGQKVEFDDDDTSKRKMLFLSESIATYSIQKPDKVKIDVISTKVSGQSNGFGLSAPAIYSFYDNKVSIGNLNPRGFISPIAENAFNYYRYKFEGSFFEDGKEINHIRVIPKRKYEPLFSGYVNIIEGDWRIHSVQLMLTKESQMELIDTLKLDQLYAPFDKNLWVIKSQVIYPSIKFLGFDGYGSFLNVYSKFELNPKFEKHFFGNTILKYGDSSNKRSKAYWEIARPVPLQLEEIIDYKKKDSLEQARKDPKYLDSLDRRRNKITGMNLMLTGVSFSRQKTRSFYSFSPLLDMIGFNTVEGLVINFNATYSKRLDSELINRHSFFINPDLRYGFSNHHFNASASAAYNFGSRYKSSVTVSGGKKIFQLNNENPIRERDNTFSTLEYKRNYMKIYEAWVTGINYSRKLDDGFGLNVGLQYQDRIPLENTTDYVFRDRKDVSYTPNYPTELANENFKRHKAFITSFGINWQPAMKYIELPGRKVSIGSKYPSFLIDYTMALKNVFGSAVKYNKWKFGIKDTRNLKLLGQFTYRITIGGFMNRDSVNIPDYTHFNGNQLASASPYLNSFQLAPYYRYSNTESFYATLHAEHHFNGFLTNKIPFFRKLNWYLVGGTNTFYVNKKNNYFEGFVGIENILKIIRIDFIWGFNQGQRPVTGFRIGLKGAFSGRSNE
jgi:hypothetical protein